MSKQKNKKIQSKPSLPANQILGKWLLRNNPAEVVLSSRMFYGVFLGLGIGMAVLLHAAGFYMPVAEVNLPDMDARQTAAITGLVTGYPIEAMIPGIAEQTKITSAFLVSIAKKESNWGKRVPRAADGTDCYNYWGYTGAGSRGVAMGHACFASPEEALSVVGKRIDYLVEEYDINTPEEFIVWKCGWNCAGHTPQSVRKWVRDVAYYYDKVQN